MGGPPVLDKFAQGDADDPEIPTDHVVQVSPMKVDEDGDPIIKTGPVTNAEPPWKVFRLRNKAEHR